MAWDKDRPYFPLDKDGNIDDYDWGFTPEKEDVEAIYRDGKAEVRCQWRNGDAKTFIPFKDVRLTLYADHFMQRRAAGTLWWRDRGGNRYPMFMGEFNRILKEHECLSIPIDGYWSAQKRGANYGIQLVRLAEEEA